MFQILAAAHNNVPQDVKASASFLGISLDPDTTYSAAIYIMVSSLQALIYQVLVRTNIRSLFHFRFFTLQKV